MATREIVELPDKHTGDINEIRDKKIALASEATAQSDLPQQLEYLIKNGQTGEFMNVLDSYINEKIRVALGTLVYNFDKDGAVSRVLGIDANKDLGSTSLSSLASVLGESIYDIFIVTRGIIEDYPRFGKLDQASSLRASAVGIAIVENGKMLIVSKDGASNQKWANSNVSGGNTGLNVSGAIQDMNGKNNTDKIISTLGSNAPAATYCRNYYPSSVVAENDTFFGKNRWWLPSGGEIWMMFSHLKELNYALSLINGTLLDTSAISYWTSSENSAAGAWRLYFSSGDFNYNGKNSSRNVRAVTAIY